MRKRNVLMMVAALCFLLGGLCNAAMASESNPTRYWGFEFGETTMQKLASAQNDWYGSSSSYYYTSYSGGEEISLSCVDSEGNVYNIPELEGITFGCLDGYEGNSYQIYLYTDGSNRIRLNKNYVYMKFSNLCEGMRIKIHYKSASSSSYRGFSCSSGNAVYESGSETTDGTEADVVYVVTKSGDVSLLPTNGVYVYSVDMDTKKWLVQLQSEVETYLLELGDYAGLKAELQAALDASNPAEDTDEVTVAGLYSNLNSVYSSVKNAVDCIAGLAAYITQAEEMVNAGCSNDLSQALESAKAFNSQTATSAVCVETYENLTNSIAIEKSYSVVTGNWNFTETLLIDRTYWFDIDHTNKLAQFKYPNLDNIESLIVPSTIVVNGEKYVVVSIANSNGYWGSDQFYNVKELLLPNTIRKIGYYAFGCYPNLSWMELPENVEVIEENAFNYTSIYWIKLNSQVPPTCTGNIGGTSFKRLIIPNGTMHEYRLSDYLGNYNLITETPIEVSVNVVDPGDLGRLVLEKAGYLQEVNKLTVTGELNSDDWASLKDMSNVTDLDISGIVNTHIPSSQFYDNWALENVKFPNGLKSIGNEAFYGMGIIEIVLPEGLETIGNYAFNNCNNATKIELPSTLKTIGYYAFAENSSVKSVVIPNSVTSIGRYAFNDCFGLEELVLSENITEIREHSFAYTKIKTLNIPENVTTIWDGAFYSCKKLSQVNLNDGLKTIASNAFAYCDSIKHIDFNEGLQTIGDNAFYDCDGLTEVTLPSSLTYCTSSPFTNCRNLKKINARSVIPPTTNGYCPLDGVSLNSVVLTVPVWSVQEYQLAEGWNQFMTVEASDYLPQNVVINKNFVFSLTQAFADDYKPNINLEMTSAWFTDSWNYNDYQRGNLTISSQSKLNVNDFNFISSPYAKYHYDYGRYHDYWSTTEVNPTCLLVNGEMRAENVNMRMKLYKSKWQFVSFPFDVKVSDIVPVDPETQWVIREYSGANRAEGLLDTTWVNIKGESVLSAGKGYIMHCYNNSDSYVVDFDITPYKQSVNRQGLFFAEDKTVALEEHLAEFEHNRSWNLIGNPYPTFYDTRFLGFESPITVWNSYTNSYYAYSPVDDSYILDPNEAFFVQRPIDQENMTFAKEGRQVHRHVRTLEQNIRANAYQVMAPRSVYNLTLGDENMSDRTRIVINEAAELGYELNCDASKFMSDNAQMPQLYTLNGDVRYAINERPLAGGEVALGCRLPKDGTYTIALETNIEGEVYIEDRLTGEIVLLTSEGYSFTANAGEYMTRFVVHFGPVAPTGIDGVGADAADKVSGVTLDGKAIGESYKGIVVNKNRKSFKK